MRGEIGMSEARAAATTHVAGHAVHAANYALSAASFASAAVVPTDSAAASAEERDWQHRRLPKHLRPVVAFPARGNNWVRVDRVP